MGLAEILEKMRDKHLGHVTRSAETSVIKTVLQYETEGNQPRSRPKKRWLDKIRQVLEAEP